MVKNSVLWKLKDSAGGRTRLENGALIKERLEALRGVIAGMLAIEVGLGSTTTAPFAEAAPCSVGGATPRACSARACVP
jgi:hypothetical protein